jgi:hypothetical protein
MNYDIHLPFKVARRLARSLHRSHGSFSYFCCLCIHVNIICARAHKSQKKKQPKKADILEEPKVRMLSSLNQLMASYTSECLKASYG